MTLTATRPTTADSAAPTASTPQRTQRSPWPAWVYTVIAVVVLIAGWQLTLALGGGAGLLPGPLETLQRAGEMLRDPFYVDGPASVGIGWHLLASLQRVLTGFGLAVLIAVPLGIVLGTVPVLRSGIDPIVQVLKPVSPLAWLPLGLALWRDAENTAIFVIAITALWPALVATIDAVRGINPRYHDLAATLQSAWYRRVGLIILPAAAPGIITGLRQSLATAWLVIIAAEMLVGGRGMGYVVWSEWNKLQIDSIIVAILLIGLVGVVLDRAVDRLRGLVAHAH